MDVIDQSTAGFCIVGNIPHQPTAFHVIASRIQDRHAALFRQFHNQLAVRVLVPFPGDQHSIRPLPRHRREDTLDLQRCPLRQEHPVHQNSQLATGVPQDVPSRPFPHLAESKKDAGARQQYCCGNEPLGGCYESWYGLMKTGTTLLSTPMADTLTASFRYIAQRAISVRQGKRLGTLRCN